MESPKMPYMTLNSGKKRKRRRSSVRAALGLLPAPRPPEGRIKQEPAWRKAKAGGWKFARTSQEIRHNCRACGKGRYAYSVECLKFWRATPAGIQILTNINKNAHSRPLSLSSPCLCLGARGRLTPRLLRLLAEGKIHESTNYLLIIE
jgi:hypothetical protein